MGGEWPLTDLCWLIRTEKARRRLRWRLRLGDGRQSKSPGARGTTASPWRWCLSPWPSTGGARGPLTGWISGPTGNSAAPGLPTLSPEPPSPRWRSFSRPWSVSCWYTRQGVPHRPGPGTGRLPALSRMHPFGAGRGSRNPGPTGLVPPLRRA